MPIEMSPGDPALDPAPLSTSLVPEHQLLRQIASGAYGQVWLARNQLGAFRAVKIVRRVHFDHERPFEREFAGIKAFEPISRGHDSFVHLMQVGRDDEAGFFYYVMELADALDERTSNLDHSKEAGNRQPELLSLTGQAQDRILDARQWDQYVPRTLDSELKHRGRLPLEECIRIGLALCDALAHLHRQGLVHRDVKPSNIIFVGGAPKLADVGLVTGAGARSFVGTEGFIPPEGPGTPQADIYSLGIVLYTMSTGKSHQAFPEPPSDLAAQPDHAHRLELDAIIHKACQAEPGDRYQTAEQMQQELALLQRGGSIKGKRAAQRRRTIAKKVGLASAIAGLLIAALLFWNGAPRGHTPNPEAVRLYQLGRWYYSQLTPEAHAKALEFLTRAVQVDPKFMQPYGEWMALYTWYQLPGPCSEQLRLQKTREIADQALAIDPNAAEGHMARSWCKFLERDWREAEETIKHAIKLNPKLAMAHDVYSFYLSMQGRTAEARAEAQRAEALEPPGSARVTAIIGAWPFVAERRFDLAIQQLQRVMELDRNFTSGHLHLAQCYDAQSNYAAAIEEFKNFALLIGQDRTRIAAHFGALREAYQTQGDTGYLRQWIELIRADQELPEEQQMFYEMDIVGYYARLGEKEKALDVLEKHFDEPQVWHQIKFKAMYDPLHNEPRFKALLKRAGFEP